MAFSTQQFTSPKTNPVTAKCVFQHTANSRGFQSVHPLRIAHFARGRSTTNNNNLSCQAVASTATPVATSDTRAPSSAAAATATSVWPCRSGHIVSVLQTATDGGAHSLQIIVQGLEEGETAQLLWYALPTYLFIYLSINQSHFYHSCSFFSPSFLSFFYYQGRVPQLSSRMAAPRLNRYSWKPHR